MDDSIYLVHCDRGCATVGDVVASCTEHNVFFAVTLDTTTAMLLGKSMYSLRAVIGQALGNKVCREL